MSVIATGLAAAALVGLLTWHFTKRSTSRLPLPPGPRRLPFVGNVFNIPREKESLVYNQMAQRYGDVVHLEVLGQHVIILNSMKAAVDLFERRSAIYSSRPISIMLSKLMGLEDWDFGLMTYGERWRSQRRMFHSQMHMNTAPKFQSVQTLQARQFLKQLMGRSDDLPATIRGAVGATIMDVVYGIQVTGTADPYIVRPEKVIQLADAAIKPGAYLVDLLPLLRYVPQWFPGAEFHRFAASYRKLSEDMLDKPMEEVDRVVASGDIKPCMVLELLRESWNKEKPEEQRKTIRDVAGMAYVAGADTTVSTLLSLFLAMANYPEVQAKAQAELDGVIGPDRLPEFADRVNLPYINAIISELLRWQPVAPMGVPHTTTADDEYNGYFIPKNSVILGNIWAILQDPEEYPDPEEFRPERFLVDGVPSKTVRDPRLAAFGFGRRICPGRHLAEQSVFIIVASVLSVFSVTPPIDEHGKPVLCKVEMSKGFISHPLPFECTVKPRSSRAAELIEQPLPDRGL